MRAPIDVTRLIDDRPVSGFQWITFVICMTIAFLDGLDLQTIGVAAPALAESWRLSRESLGPVFTAAPAGMIIGALIFGPLADRIGRKRLVVTATLVFGASSLLTAHAASVGQLALLRFVTGVGLGGVLPNLLSLVTEYAPLRLRGVLTAFVFSSLPLGSTLAGIVAPWLIPAYGWQSIFYVGGLLPIVIALLAIKWLPESLRYLVSVGERREEIVRILRRLAPDISAESLGGAELRVGANPGPAQKASVRALFGPNRTFATFMLATIVGLNLFMINLLVNWLPTLLSHAGLSGRSAMTSVAFLNVAGAVGAIAWGACMDRFGIYRVMGFAALCSSLAMAALAFGHSDSLVLIVTLMVVGWCVLGAQPGFYALIASVYPTRIRSTGVGTTLGIGRIGSVLGPAIGGLLVAAAVPLSGIFLIISGAGLLCACAVATLNRLRPDFE